MSSTTIRRRNYHRPGGALVVLALLITLLVAGRTSAPVTLALSNDHPHPTINGPSSQVSIDALAVIWGEYGEGDGQFIRPGRVAIDATGNIYVADSGNDRIQKFNADRQFLQKWGSRGDGDGQFWNPTSIAFDTAGNVYVTDTNNHRVQKFNSVGVFLGKWGTEGDGDGEFFWPSGIKFDSAGNIYITDTINHRVQVFTPAGQFLRKWGGEGSDPGQFNTPGTLAIDDADNIYVADRWNHRIQVFSSNGTFLRTWGSYGANDGQFNDPYAVEISNTGHVYVADTLNHRIQEFTANGGFLAKWGSQGNADEQLNWPTGLAIDRLGNIYVADRDNSRIVIFPSTNNKTTTRVSVSSGGVQGNDDSHAAAISDDGRYVAFHSYANNLVPGDTNNNSDLFVHDRYTGRTVRASVNSAGEEVMGLQWGPSISADGRYVSFWSGADSLVSGDTNFRDDIFVHDMQSGETTRVSVNSAGTQANSDSTSPSLSADGRLVTFSSGADNLVPGDTNKRWDIFVHDRQTAATMRVSVSSNGTQANQNSDLPEISNDGRYVVFSSYATNLVPNDTNSERDVFVHDRQTGATTRISVSSGGVQGNGDSMRPSVSADGRYICFDSSASNLVPNDTNGYPDAFVHDRQTGETRRISVSSTGVQGNNYVNSCSMSAGGRYVAFDSWASNLVDGDINNDYDVYVHDLQTSQTARVSVSSTGVLGNYSSTYPNISADGRSVAFSSEASNLVEGDTNGVVDIFIHEWVGVNHPPVANDLSVSTEVNAAVPIVLSASDADDDHLTYYVGAWPQHGTLGGTPPNLIYTPNTDFYGQDSLRYIANDGKVNSNEATVNITVKTPLPPGILKVRRQFARYFLKGQSHQNMIEVTVRWPQGNKPQSIAIRRPDGTQLAVIPAYDIRPAPDGTSINTVPINMIGCPLGSCPITVVAIGSVNASEPQVNDFFYTVAMPEALSANGLRKIAWTPKGSGWTASQDYGQFSSQMLNGIPELAAAEPIMRNALDLADDTHPFRIPSWVPLIGGDYGADLSTLRVTDSAVFSTLDGSMQTETSGHLDYRLGNMAGPISFDLAGQSSYVRDETFVRFDVTRLDFSTSGHRLGADFTLPGIIRLSVDRPYTGHLWAVYRPTDKDPLSGSIYGGGADINTTIESSGSVNALVAKAKVTLGGGVTLSRSFDLPTHTDISKAIANVFARVKWRVLFWSKSISKTWSCAITYSSDPVAVSCTGDRSAYDLLDWHRQSRIIVDDHYAELTANEPGMLRWAGDGNGATAELKLLDNIYEDAEPEMAIDPSSGELMVVYTHDNLAADISEAYDIAYMRRTAAGWSTPLPIATNQQADVKPDVTFANGRAVAVWSTLNNAVIDEADEPEDAFPHMEIAASVFNTKTGTWSVPHLITDNNFFDFEPIVADDGNKAMAVWYADPDNDVVIGPEASEEHDMSKQLYYAIWDGSSWSAPVVLVQDVDLVGTPSLALRGGKGVLAYAVDTDGSVTSIADREIMLVYWNGNHWLAPQKLTNDGLEDLLPTVAYFNNQPWAAWLHVGSLAEGYSSFTIESVALNSQMAIQPIAVAGQVEELLFTDNGGNLPVLLWREFDQMVSNINYAVYDPQHERWSSQKALTDDDTYNADYSPLMTASGHIFSTYVKTDLSIEETLVANPSGNPTLIAIPASGRSAIYFLDHAITADLAVSANDIALTNAQPAPGESVAVEAIIHNLGDLTHSDISIRFVEVGSDKVVGSVTVDELAAGQSEAAHVIWQVSATAQMPLRLAIEVDPENVIVERDEANNRTETAVGLPDLAATFVEAEETANRQLILHAVIENLGRSSPDDQVVVNFYYNDRPVITDAVYIGDKNINAPAPGESMEVEYVWATPNIASGDYQLFVVVDPANSVDDPQRSNNQLYTAFRRSAGSAPDILDVSVSPTISRVSVAPGTIAIHRPMVTNSGNVSERFDIMLLASEWTANAPVQIGPLEPGHSALASILVTVPANASGTSEATYLIRSRTDGTKSAQVKLITEARAKIYMPIVR